MKQVIIPKQLFIKNRRELVKNLSPNSIVVVFSADRKFRNGDQFFPYRQDSNFYYLTGFPEENCRLILYPENVNQTEREFLFIQETDEKAKIWEGCNFSKEEASEITGIQTVKFNTDFESIFSALIDRVDNIYLDFSEEHKDQSIREDSTRRFISKCKEEFSRLSYHSVLPLIVPLRLIKQPEELELINQACQITGHAFIELLGKITPGIMEYEVEAELIHEIIKLGSSGHAFHYYWILEQNMAIMLPIVPGPYL